MKIFNIFKSLFKDDSVQKGLLHFINTNRTKLRSNADQQSYISKSMSDIEHDFASLIKATNDILEKGDDSYQLKLKHRHETRLEQSLNDLREEQGALDQQQKQIRGALREAVAQYQDCLIKAEQQMAYEKFVEKYSKDVIREQLPQPLNTMSCQQIIDLFGANKAEMKKIEVNKLKPTQKDIDSQKVLSILSGTTKLNTAVVVDKDNHIIDGHHRWAAMLELNPSQQVDVICINDSLKNVLNRFDKQDQDKLQKSHAEVVVPLKKDDVYVDSDTTYELAQSLKNVVKAYKSGQVSDKVFKSIQDKFNLSDSVINQLKNFDEHTK